LPCCPGKGPRRRIRNRGWVHDDRTVYTGDQSLVDALHKDPRRSRGAAINIVPTTTGAARATGLVLPSVAGTLDGLALRVPVPDASITDLVANARTTPTVSKVKDAYQAAAESGRLSGLLEYSDEPLVSSDIVGSPFSCVFDSELTMAHGHLVEGSWLVRQRVGLRQSTRRPGGHHRSHLGVPRIDGVRRRQSKRVSMRTAARTECGHRLDDMSSASWASCPKKAEGSRRFQKLVAGPGVGHSFYDQSCLRLL
jgi:hypothetical protein